MMSAVRSVEGHVQYLDHQGIVMLYRSQQSVAYGKNINSSSRTHFVGEPTEDARGKTNVLSPMASPHPVSSAAGRYTSEFRKGITVVKCLKVSGQLKPPESPPVSERCKSRGACYLLRPSIVPSGLHDPFSRAYFSLHLVSFLGTKRMHTCLKTSSWTSSRGPRARRW